eukprot:tig00021135_g18924.t1
MVRSEAQREAEPARGRIAGSEGRSLNWGRQEAAGEAEGAVRALLEHRRLPGAGLLINCDPVVGHAVLHLVELSAWRCGYEAAAAVRPGPSPSAIDAGREGDGERAPRRGSLTALLEGEGQGAASPGAGRAPAAPPTPPERPRTAAQALRECAGVLSAAAANYVVFAPAAEWAAAVELAVAARGARFPFTARWRLASAAGRLRAGARAARRWGLRRWEAMCEAELAELAPDEPERQASAAAAAAALCDTSTSQY